MRDHPHFYFFIYSFIFLLSRDKNRRKEENMVDTSTHACEPVDISLMQEVGNVENPLRSPNQEFIELNCVCLDSDSGSGSNKFYRMKNNHDGTFTATYGRIGVTSGFGAPRSFVWDMNMWETKYYEKAHEHGYFLVKTYETEVEETEDIPAPKKKGGRPRKDVDAPIRKIVTRIIGFAKHIISENYSVESTAVTKEMVDNAEKKLNSLINDKDNLTLGEFNDRLLNIFSLIPRRMDTVSWYIAKSTNDFNSILLNEESLLDTMRSQIDYHKKTEVSESGRENIATLLKNSGLEWRECTDEELQNIKNHIGRYSGQIKGAWRIVNKKTEKKFNAFCEKNNLTKRGVQFLFHGSRNENFWSIITNGLKINPGNVRINGKMFGYGIYFANKAAKSMGYTSGYGSKWANGNSSSAFLAIFKVAVGDPLNVHTWQSKYSSFDYNRLQREKSGAHSLFAHAGASLLNDEIIIYKEEQCTLRYLVEIGV